jgi:4-carboxymuconolactone decarboxylase
MTTTADPLIPLPRRTSADTEGDSGRVLGKLEESGQIMKIHGVLANSSSVFRPLMLLASALMTKTPFPAYEREVVILRMAARRGVAYEWGEHVALSAKAGVDDAARENLAKGDGADLTLLSARARLAVDVADQVVDHHRLDPALWDRAVAEWGEEASLDLVFVVAWWGGFVPLVIEALGLRDPHS